MTAPQRPQLTNGGRAAQTSSRTSVRLREAVPVDLRGSAEAHRLARSSALSVTGPHATPTRPGGKVAERGAQRASGARTLSASTPWCMVAAAALAVAIMAAASAVVTTVVASAVGAMVAAAVIMAGTTAASGAVVEALITAQTTTLTAARMAVEDTKVVVDTAEAIVAVTIAAIMAEGATVVGIMVVATTIMGTAARNTIRIIIGTGLTTTYTIVMATT